MSEKENRRGTMWYLIINLCTLDVNGFYNNIFDKTNETFMLYKGANTYIFWNFSAFPPALLTATATAEVLSMFLFQFIFM